MLEGGSIDTNGAGVLLTTEECLLSTVQQRNPGVSREQLEQAFHDYLGIDQVLWMNRGIAGDDTHGHVDDITRFVDANTIVTVVETNRADENHGRWPKIWTGCGPRATATESPSGSWSCRCPRPWSFDGQRLPASYANFYIANGLVLVPTFNDPNDRGALNTLAELFPDRRSGRHSLRGPHLGTGRAALHDAAAAGGIGDDGP